MSASSVARPYRGIAASERVASRREALMRAGLDVFDTEGWSALSARRVCEVAGLTRRYFYESFEDIDQLVAAIFVSITGDVTDAIKAAINDQALGFGARVERAVAAGLATLQPPVRGRFLVAAQRGCGPVDPHRTAVLDDLMSLVGSALFVNQEGTRQIEPADSSIALRMVVGAVLALVDGWFEGDVKLSRGDVSSRAATAAVAIIEALGERREPVGPSGP